MKVVLHLGAHRTGCASFRSTLYALRPHLAEHQVEVWDPRRMRAAAPLALAQTAQVSRRARRLDTHVRIGVAAAVRRERSVLLIPDQDLMGSLGQTLQTRQMYSACADRLSRVYSALGQVDRIVLQIRTPAEWWTSVCAHLAMTRGTLPDLTTRLAIAAHPRRWRHVVQDIARSCPLVEICVVPFEDDAARPLAVADLALFDIGCSTQSVPDYHQRQRPDVSMLQSALDVDLPTMDGVWTLFDADQRATLDAAYADDMDWLRAGADGLATLIETPKPHETADLPVVALQARGP